MTALPVLKGRAWIFGDNLDADWDICDLHQLQELAAKGVLPGEKELGERCLVSVDPEFPRKVRRGDLIVAGRNTGCSSACLDGLPYDPHMLAFASLALKAVGIGAVLCESAAPTFQRNSIHAGLPVIECRGIGEIVRQGDEIEVDLEAGMVKNLTAGAQLQFAPFPDFILRILDAGGLYPYLKREAQSDESLMR